MKENILIVFAVAISLTVLLGLVSQRLSQGRSRAVIAQRATIEFIAANDEKISPNDSMFFNPFICQHPCQFCIKTSSK